MTTKHNTGITRRTLLGSTAAVAAGYPLVDSRKAAASVVAPFIPYVPGSFLTSPAAGAPIDDTRTKTMQNFMATFADQKAWKYPSVQGVGGNLWGTAYAMGQSSDPIWKLTGSGIPTPVLDQLKNKGFHAPSGFGSRITGTSDSPFCVIDMANGITVFGTKAVYVSGTTISVQSGGCMWHSSNGLDGRNPLATNKNNRTSRGRISEALVIRRDLMDYAIANNTGLGHVLHMFIAETGSGHCHPMTGDEGTRAGFGIEGERIIIRPDVDLSTRGMSPAGLVLARTIQQHGMYIGDNAGKMSTLKAEVETSSHMVWNGLLQQDSLRGVTWADMACVKAGWQA